MPAPALYFAAIANLTLPWPGIEDLCGGVEKRGHGGAAYTWCAKALAVHRAGAGGPGDLVGHSFGINTWDTWSRWLSNDFSLQTDLYDCYATAELKGPNALYTVPYRRHNVCVGARSEIKQTAYSNKRELQFKTIQETALEGRGPLSTLVKVDVEGCEWEVLAGMRAEDHEKILQFDLEIHWCTGLPCAKRQDQPHMFHSARESARYMLTQLKRLRRFYFVLARDMSRSKGWDVLEKPRSEIGWDDAGCDLTKHYDMMSISLVNKQLFQ